MDYEIDYTIFRNAESFSGTDLFEIGPGRYSGVHWQEGFIFVREEAFASAERALYKYVDGYEHYDMNDIKKEIGLKVISAWRNVANALGSAANPTDAADILEIHESRRHRFEDEVFRDRNKIAAMLSELADECEAFYKSNEWICILGL